MVDSENNIYIDKEIREQASAVFKKLGISLNDGINLYLRSVIKLQGIPFPLILNSPNSEEINASEFKIGMEKFIEKKLSDAKSAGHPVALYDEKLGKPYLEYPDGHRDYDFAK